MDYNEWLKKALAYDPDFLDKIYWVEWTDETGTPHTVRCPSLECATNHAKNLGIKIVTNKQTNEVIYVE